MMLTSKTGNLNSSEESGFTLIELIVVLAVMGSILFITLPKIELLDFNNESHKEINILLNQVKELKKRALSDRTDYILNIDVVKSVVWITSENMTPERSDVGQFDFVNNMSSFYIIGVEIYGLSNHSREDEYQIRFSKRGYCDMSLIHLKESNTGEEFTLIIEPFLSGAEIKRKYISFNQCS